MELTWTGAGICWIQLPEETAKKTVALLRAKAPLAKKAALRPAIVKATRTIVAHVNGDSQKFAGIKLDESGLPSFHRKVSRRRPRRGPGGGEESVSGGRRVSSRPRGGEKARRILRVRRRRHEGATPREGRFHAHAARTRFPLRSARSSQGNASCAPSTWRPQASHSSGRRGFHETRRSP
jgi:hypothetical protein